MIRLDRCIWIMALVALVAFSASGWVDNRFASSVVSWTTLGPSPYNDPNAAVGKPTTWINEPGGPNNAAGAYPCSMVFAAYMTAPDGSKVVTTVGSATVPGEIILAFADPVVDDPGNWYGMDFIVFGNAILKSNGYVNVDTNMESYYINNGSVNSGPNEPLTVSVSPDMVNWYTYSSPKSDNYWPTNAFAWNRTTHNWGDELDWTKPTPASITAAMFAGKNVADAIDLYKGSAGGTAFDLAESGFSSISYIKLSGCAGEVDAISRVSKPLTAGAAKRVPDGIPVSLGAHVVTAGSSELGDGFYMETPDRSSGIKVTGKTAVPGTNVTVSGVMATVAGERVIRATWLESGGVAAVSPIAMPNGILGGADYGVQADSPTVGQRGVKNGTGLNTIGLLVRVWGRVKTAGSSTFTINDGSAGDASCSVPSGVTAPSPGDYVSVTGVCSCELGTDGLLTPLIRTRTASDVYAYSGK